MYKKELKIEITYVKTSFPHTASGKNTGFIYTEVSTECTEDSYIYKSALI